MVLPLLFLVTEDFNTFDDSCDAESNPDEIDGDEGEPDESKDRMI